MIDNRFTLTQHAEHKHLYHLRFSVVLPPERYYSTQSGLIIAECKKQYPELDFDYQGDYSARFSDGQYASCVQTRIKNSYMEELVFSLPLELDTIMSATCGFKKAVPPIQFTVYPAELVDLTSDEFHETVENMYSIIGLSLRVRDVSWRFDHISGSTPVYLITPTDYDYI